MPFLGLVAVVVDDYDRARHEPYGIVAGFEDAFGNRWDLLEPS